MRLLPPKCQSFLAKFQLLHPIIQAPMASSVDYNLASNVANTGALGSIPCAMLSPENIIAQVDLFRGKTNDISTPLNLNFFAYTMQDDRIDRESIWIDSLAKYYEEINVEPPSAKTLTNQQSTRRPFGSQECSVIEKLKPSIVSFHFGLPPKPLIERLKACDISIWSSATTVDEAKYLVENGADVIIAQGYEAGGHRGSFLYLEDEESDLPTINTKPLLKQIVDKVGPEVHVVAAGGIADGRNVCEALLLGASAVQIGR